MAKYTLRRLDTVGNPSKARGLPLTLSKLVLKLANWVGPYRARDNKNRSGERPSVLGLRKLVKRFLTTGATRVVVGTGGRASFAVKQVEVPAPPPPDGPGTPAIDAIRHYVRTKYPEVRDMGICANKPGEHGHCNAWDGGAPLGWSAEKIWAFIETIADDLKRQGQLHDRTGGAEGLPVNGVIVQDRYWETGNSTWRGYTGTKHVSHFHVSGKPSITGWV